MMAVKPKETIQVKRRIFVILLILGIIMTYSIEKSSILGAFRSVMRTVENKIVTYRTHDFQQIETENFILRHQGLDPELQELMIKTAEDKYRQVTHLFQYQPQSKILLIVYDNPDDMMGVTMLKKGNPPMGVYYGGSLHILDPIFWVKEDENLEEKFYYEGPVLHELVHLFTDHIGRGNYPLWFTEGVSLYFEYAVDGYEWGKEVSFEEEDYTLEQLTISFGELDQYRAYTKAFRLVKQFVENHGLQELFHVIDELGRGRELEEFYPLFLISTGSFQTSSL